MRFILALCVVVGCTLCGKALAGASRRRVELLDQLIQGIRMLRVHMTGMFEPVQHALDRTDCPLLNRIGSDMRAGVSAGSAWAGIQEREQRRGGMIDALTREDRQALDGLFMRLGETGRDAQEVLLSGAVRTLEQNRESARHRAGEAEKLYVSLGMLTGLMLALIVV